MYDIDLPVLFQILTEECLELIERDRVLSSAVVEIGVNRVGDDIQLFVIGVFTVVDHIRICVFTELAGMRFFAVDDQHSTANLI